MLVSTRQRAGVSLDAASAHPSLDFPESRNQPRVTTLVATCQPFQKLAPRMSKFCRDVDVLIRRRGWTQKPTLLHVFLGVQIVPEEDLDKGFPGLVPILEQLYLCPSRERRKRLGCSILT